MSKLFKRLSVMLLIVIIISSFMLWYQYNVFLKTPLTLAADNATFEIKPGSNIRQAASQLEAKKLIPYGQLFLVYARLQGSGGHIKAGEYQLEPGIKPDELLKKFTAGQVLQYQLGIIEGKRFRDIVADIHSNPTIEKTLAADDFQTIMSKLGADAGMQPEGWFFPDTYHFPRKTTDLEFLKRSHKAMQDYLNKAWEGRVSNPTITTPYQALILASIVEKETGLPEERPLVARVFLNRLEKGMMLQTDPTVIYGIGDKYDGNIRKVDLQTDTPYNTYTRFGLPPTPIATPSKAAIDAVMHPAVSNALYFVATTPGGASQFSETLDQHNQAVRQYILNRKKAMEQKP